MAIDIDLVARTLLGFAALACLWLGLMAWRVAQQESRIFRLVGPALWIVAASVIVYGLARS